MLKINGPKIKVRIKSDKKRRKNNKHGGDTQEKPGQAKLGLGVVGGASTPAPSYAPATHVHRSPVDANPALFSSLLPSSWIHRLGSGNTSPVARAPSKRLAA